MATRIRMGGTCDHDRRRPHQGSHTAVAVDQTNAYSRSSEYARTVVRPSGVLAWAGAFQARTWAIEGAGGLGYLLAQQLVNASKVVVDVPATLSARVRLLRGWANSPRSLMRIWVQVRGLSLARLEHSGPLCGTRVERPAQQTRR